MIATLTLENYKQCCDKLAKKDATIKSIIKNYGYPPLYSRQPSFETLIHIILEQQVSLASAKAALVKLKEKIGTVTPQKINTLTDVELRSCYFSRQKIIYAKALATAFLDKTIELKKLANKTDEEIRSILIQIKGIGHWTADVYLMMCLQRMDLFPIGDIALVNSIKHEKKLPQLTEREVILQIAEAWKPYRTVASFLFWHAYIKRKGIIY
jgi:DNA-3-methyladenine glycosylase II